MSERDESLEFEELAVSERPLSVPDELPILPLCATPSSFRTRSCRSRSRANRPSA